MGLMGNDNRPTFINGYAKLLVSLVFRQAQPIQGSAAARLWGFKSPLSHQEKQVVTKQLDLPPHRPYLSDERESKPIKKEAI